MLAVPLAAKARDVDAVRARVLLGVRAEVDGGEGGLSDVSPAIDAVAAHGPVSLRLMQGCVCKEVINGISFAQWCSVQNV